MQVVDHRGSRNTTSILLMAGGATVGLVFAVLIAVGLYVSTTTPPAHVMPGSEVPESYRRILLEHGVLGEGEELRYMYCAGLTVEEDGNILTDRRVISYVDLDDGDDGFVASCALDQIVGFEVESRGSLIEDSLLAVSTAEESFYLTLPVDDRHGAEFEAVLRRAAQANGAARGSSPESAPATDTGTATSQPADRPRATSAPATTDPGSGR